ncbi:MAG: hypothetical protein ACT4PL_07860 [Phycisphaerales bacterium]
MPLNRRACTLAVGVCAFLGVRAFSVHADRSDHAQTGRSIAAAGGQPWAAAGVVLAGPVSTVDDAPDSPADPPDFREFRPSRNGFAFRNSFHGSPMPPGLEALGTLFGAPSHFGLCGGMSSAAADLFIRGDVPPHNTAPPQRGDALFDRLWHRQVDSFGENFGMVATFASWMNKRDDGLLGTQHLTACTLGPIARSLRKGEPVIVGMVLRGNGRGEQLWDNHQVLAYSAASDGPRIRLNVYDPNHPRNDAVAIVCTPRIIGAVVGFGPLAVRFPVIGYAGELQAAPTPERPKATRTPVRGVFAMPFSPQAR